MKILICFLFTIASHGYANDLNTTLIGLPQNTKTDFSAIKKCQDIIDERVRCMQFSMEQMGHKFSTKTFRTKYDELVKIGPACWVITFQALEKSINIQNNDYLSWVKREIIKPSKGNDWGENKYRRECRTEFEKLDACKQSIAFLHDQSIKKECHKLVIKQDNEWEEEELKKASTPAIQEDYSFSNYKMEFETGMTIGKEYSVEAFYDPNGLYICSFENSSSGGLGSCGNLNGGVVYVHHSFSKTQAQELYKLRGKAICLTTLIAGGQNWIKRFKSGSCKD